MEQRKCYVYAPENECLSPLADVVHAASYVCYSNTTAGYCYAVWPALAVRRPATTMTTYNIKPVETLTHVWHIFWTIVPIAFFFAIARIITQSSSVITKRSDSTFRFIIEFIAIALPIVLIVNVFNDYVEYLVLLLSLCMLFLLWPTRFWQRLRSRREFELGCGRPFMLTLNRASINFLTALCILAIDFSSFPKHFRKSRRYGAGLMDVGIGLFVFAMGTVSRRPRRISDMWRLMRSVIPALALGIARTVVIMAIDYQQDEHEYGKHLNAFFTLGLTKLFGGIVSAAARTDTQLLPLGLGILAVHETVLQLGLSDYVMDDDLDRGSSYFTANREGLCSLPGFIGLYLLSIYIGQWSHTNAALTFKEIMNKLKWLALITAAVCIFAINCILTIGIARVTCNVTYVAWILGIALTMSLLFLLIFDIILNTLLPIDHSTGVDGGEGNLLSKSSTSTANDVHQLKSYQLPSLVEAMNYNGLTFFLLANVLTGGVNIFLKPKDRSDMESILILTLYMLIATGSVYILYRLKIRIA